LKRDDGNGAADKDGAAVADPSGGRTAADDSKDSKAAGEAKGLTAVDGSAVPPLSREEIEALRRERDELKEQLLRKRADFEKYRKRVERDREQASQEATAKVIQALIPNLDNLDRALEAGGGEAALREGVELIRRGIQTFLEDQGVVIDDPLGRHFDPQMHQALSHEPVPGVEDGTVVEVYRKGYLFTGRLLRPALVKVAKGRTPAKDGEPEAIH